MDKYLWIELMVINGSISLERAEQLVDADFDTIEGEWVRSAETNGAFAAGQAA